MINDHVLKLFLTFIFYLLKSFPSRFTHILLKIVDSYTRSQPARTACLGVDVPVVLRYAPVEKLQEFLTMSGGELSDLADYLNRKVVVTDLSLKHRLLFPVSQIMIDGRHEIGHIGTEDPDLVYLSCPWNIGPA